MATRAPLDPRAAAFPSTNFPQLLKLASDRFVLAYDTKSFDTANTGTDATVPGTAGNTKDITITLTNADSLAAGDILRLAVSRNVGHATDTAAGDLYMHVSELRDAA